MAVQAVLAARREQVLQRWNDLVRGDVAPEALPAFELVDHMPPFLDGIIAALGGGLGVAPTHHPAEKSPAAEHGHQRLRLGFSVEAVVREYKALRDAIFQVLAEAGAVLTFDELQVIFDSIIGGITEAVTEYAHQRDAELLRQSNEHFAFVAHELRNPIGAARSAFQLLKSKQLLPETHRAVRALERSLARVSELINHTLELARSVSGIEVHCEPTRLRELLDEAELAVRADAEAKQVELRVACASDAVLSLDLRLVRSALDNLMQNAVKYSCVNGEVELRATVDRERTTIEVEDSCGGLPPGKVEQAFAPFVRLDTRHSGFGLGLAIAKQAAEAHGGTIRVQDLPGKGCIFVLELPLGPGEPGAGKPG